MPSRARELPDVAPSGPTSGIRHVTFISGAPNGMGHIYRVVNRVADLRRLGLIADWISLDDLSSSSVPHAADVVIAYRCEVTDALTVARRECVQRGVPWGVDFDDLIFLPGLMSASEVHFLAFRSDQSVARWKARSNRWQAAVRMADFAWAPTRSLASEFMALGIPATVVPNGIDPERVTVTSTIDRRRDDDIVHIGYAAGTMTHQADFEQVVPALAELLDDDPRLRFTALGHLDTDAFQALRLRASQIDHLDTVPFAQLPLALATFDINIAPLVRENRFCEAKSELKFFEAALVRVPTVASATQPYSDAIRHGHTGLLVQHPEQWREALRHLKADAGERSRLGENARTAAIAAYGPERQSRDVLEALRRLPARGTTSTA